jgi:hypothetical protein
MVLCVLSWQTGRELLGFTAGAHINVEVTPGRTIFALQQSTRAPLRQYSRHRAGHAARDRMRSRLHHTASCRLLEQTKG